MNITSTLQRRWSHRRIPAPRGGPAGRLALPLAHEAGLRFTDWLVFAGLALACLFSISTPLFGVKLFITGISHLPLALLGPVLVLHLVGKSLNRFEQQPPSALGATWPLVALALFALVGSSLAKWYFRIDDTYFSFAVYTLMLPLYVAVAPTEAARARRWAGAMIGLLSLVAVAALIGEAVRFRGSEALHEIEYLVTTGFLMLFLVSRRWGWKVLALVLMVAAAVLNRKLTGFIVVAMALTHIVVASGWRKLLPQWRGFYGISASACVLGLSVVLLLLYFEYRQYLPSGNVDVRMRQYEAAWAAFERSPVWGTAFMEGSGEDFREALRLFNIPTHSDVLDILKHGGMIGLALFAWGYWKLFALIQSGVRATRSDRVLSAYFVGMRFLQVTALFTFLINPLLLKGPFLIVIWGSLGLAAGLALTLRHAGSWAGTRQDAATDDRHHHHDHHDQQAQRAAAAPQTSLT